MCFIIFPSVLHLRCMTLFLIIFDAISQIQIGTEMVMRSPLGCSTSWSAPRYRPRPPP
jgi:hypothetical protein